MSFLVGRMNLRLADFHKLDLQYRSISFYTALAIHEMFSISASAIRRTNVSMTSSAIN